jgi:hypothetical protein
VVIPAYSDGGETGDGRGMAGEGLQEPLVGRVPHFDLPRSCSNNLHHQPLNQNLHDAMR